METKTIGIRKNVYERLKAEKRDDESFTDTVERLLEESPTDWHEGSGSLSAENTEELERVSERSRRSLGEGLLERQQDALETRGSGSDDDPP